MIKWIEILIGLVLGAGLVYLTERPCPACNCPPAVEVKLNEFDPGKINNKKGSFSYAPHNTITGTIIVSDSTIRAILLQQRDTAK